MNEELPEEVVKQVEVKQPKKNKSQPKPKKEVKKESLITSKVGDRVASLRRFTRN